MIETINLRSPADRRVSFRMDLDPSFVSDQHILEYVSRAACYEPDVAWVLMRALRPGDTCVDVGACVGFFTLLMAQLVGPEGRVVAVEPGLDNLTKLRQNIMLNHSTVEICERPLFATRARVGFYHNHDSSGGHALWDPGLWEGNIKTRENSTREPAWLDATTLNRICPPDCRLIKIDTEGAEERILQGANNMLAEQHPPFIVAEMNQFGLSQMQSTPDILRSYMRLFGYDTFMLYPDGAKPELVPPRKAVVCDHIWNVLFSTPADVASIWT